MIPINSVGGDSMPIRSAAVLACTATLLMLALPLGAVDTSAQARAIITDMSLATKTLNYDGTFVYMRGSNAASLRIIHKADTGGERERLVSLSGSAKEVVRNNREVTCIFPGDRAVMVDTSRPTELVKSGLPQPIEKISDYYKYSVLGGDRVAGRPTWVVGIVPKGDDRFGYRLWVDTSLHLVLKSEVIDVSGAVLEQVLFTTIETPGEIPDSLLQPSVSGQGYTWYKNERGSQPVLGNAEADWVVDWLPPGFSMQDHLIHAIDRNAEPVNQRVNHMVFSDGLATVSVFVEKPARENDRIEGFSSLGAVHTYSRMSDGHQIMVVGELPSATLRRIAASVTPRTDAP